VTGHTPFRDLEHKPQPDRRYRKIPVEVEAVRWDGENVQLVAWFCHPFNVEFRSGSAFISTLEGRMEARKGDWIIKGVEGEVYPCKPGIFAQTYEEVGDEPA